MCHCISHNFLQHRSTAYKQVYSLLNDIQTQTHTHAKATRIKQPQVSNPCTMPPIVISQQATCTDPNETVTQAPPEMFLLVPSQLVPLQVYVAQSLKKNPLASTLTKRRKEKKRHGKHLRCSSREYTEKCKTYCSETAMELALLTAWQSEEPVTVKEDPPPAPQVVLL